MTTIAQLTIDRSESGIDVSRELDAIPAPQWGVYWTDLSELCPSRLSLGPERRRANALNIEIGAPLHRCKEQSPDGRGLAWLLSGGSPLAYGHCTRKSCPRRMP